MRNQPIIKLSSNYHILRVLCCNFAVLGVDMSSLQSAKTPEQWLRPSPTLQDPSKNTRPPPGIKANSSQKNVLNFL